MAKFDPMSYYTTEQSGRSYRSGFVTPPPPYDSRAHGMAPAHDSSRHGTSIGSSTDKHSPAVPQGAAIRRHYQAMGAGNSPLNANGYHHQPLHEPISYQCEEKKFLLDHHSNSHINGSSDFASHHCRTHHRRPATESPQTPGSTCSSQRSSISTLASTGELRHLACGSPYSQCSPSPALLDYRQHSSSPRPSCTNCQSPGSRPLSSRSSLFASPADTVILHSRNDSFGSTQGPLLAARYHSGFVSSSTSGLCSCHHQHTPTPPPLLMGGGKGGGGGGGVIKQCASYQQLPYRQPPVVFSSTTPPTAAPSYRRLVSAAVSLLDPLVISPAAGAAVALNNNINTHNKTSLSTTTATPARSVSALNGAACFSPAFLQQCAPLRNNCCNTASFATDPAFNSSLKAERPMMNRSRDISAPVFSQACSEDLEDEPPPYKPPSSRPKVPTTTAKNLNRSSNVEKKIEQLTEELSHITVNTSIDSGEVDDDSYYGQCYACSERVIGEECACQAMGNLYHTNCFVCNICGRILRGKAFYHVKGQIMCEEDYLYSGFQSSADKCVACGHLIMDMILQALGKSYHPGCFRCCTCNKTLDGAPFTVDIEGKIFCIEDYQGRYAPTCASCKLPITPVEGSDETIRVVSMEQNFHVDCYACEDCGLQLTDKPKERRCYPLDGHLLCHACHVKRRETTEQRRASRVSLPDSGVASNSSGSSSVRSSIRSRHPLQL